MTKFCRFGSNFAPEFSSLAPSALAKVQLYLKMSFYREHRRLGQNGRSTRELVWCKNTTPLLISGYAGAFTHYITPASEFSTLKTYISLLGVSTRLRITRTEVRTLYWKQRMCINGSWARSSDLMRYFCISWDTDTFLNRSDFVVPYLRIPALALWTLETLSQHRRSACFRKSS